MLDQFGRTIDYMRISLTDRCNLRCRYCMPEDIELLPMAAVLTFEEIEEVCREAAQLGVRKLKITGGEPLVRRGAPALIGQLKKVPGIEQVTLTTNGVLLAQYLPELLAAGLDAVNVSLDTLDAAPHGLHLKAASFACAAGQAGAYRRIEPELTEEERAVFRRGRNAHSGTVPKNAAISDYRTATGLEALVGWLYLKDREERLDRLFHMILEETDGGEEPQIPAGE